MRITFMAGASASILVAAPLHAQNAAATFELPRLQVDNYLKPYVAVWLENEAGMLIEVYAVHVNQMKLGPRWLPDLKTWWRRGGREMNMEASGVSRPTKGPGEYKVAMGPMKGLAAGNYALVVEAARQNGGREIVKVPFSWKPGAKVAASTKGTSELGRVALSITP